MNKIIYFYLANDAIVKSAPLFLVIFLSSFLPDQALNNLALFTISFSIFSNVFSFGQISLLSKFFFIEKNINETPLNNLFVPVFLNLIFFLIFIFINKMIAFGALLSIFWLLYQTKQISNNVNNLYMKYIQNDQLFMLGFVCVSLLWLFFYEANEWLRIIPFLLSYAILVLWNFRNSKITLKLDRKLIYKNLKSGIFVTLFSLYQWFVAFGDKTIISYLYGIEVSNSVFVLTQFLQIYLLGSLAIMKFFRPILAVTIKQEGNYFNILIKYLFFLLLGLIITGIIFYYLNPKILNISLSHSLIIGYFIIYWAISITFFLYQIAIFRSQEDVVARITIENLFICSPNDSSNTD